MASKRRIRRKSCEGKARHESADAAKIAIRLLVKKQGYTGQINAYRCKFCRFFHIGHSGR